MIIVFDHPTPSLWCAITDLASFKEAPSKCETVKLNECSLHPNWLLVHCREWGRLPAWRCRGWSSAPPADPICHPCLVWLCLQRLQRLRAVLSYWTLLRSIFMSGQTPQPSGGCIGALPLAQRSSPGEKFILLRLRECTHAWLSSLVRVLWFLTISKSTGGGVACKTSTQVDQR